MLHQPRNLNEALALKAELGGDIDALAGGTDLLVAANRGQWRPKNILDLTRISGFDALDLDGDRYSSGGGVTHTQLTRLPITMLREACLSIGGPQIRNRGTLAGNLGTASPAGDACVAMLALHAEVTLTHAKRGSRTLPVRDYFLDYRRTELQPDELITAVSFPRNWQTAWYKIGKRGSVNISIVCAAVGRSPEGKFGVAFGSVGPYPLYAPRTEALLNDAKLTPALIDEAAGLAMKEVSPISDHRASANYRRAMCGTLLRRLLTESFLNGTGN